MIRHTAAIMMMCMAVIFSACSRPYVSGATMSGNGTDCENQKDKSIDDITHGFTFVNATSHPVRVFAYGRQVSFCGEKRPVPSGAITRIIVNHAEPDIEVQIRDMTVSVPVKIFEETEDAFGIYPRVVGVRLEELVSMPGIEVYKGSLTITDEAFERRYPGTYKRK